MKNELVITKGDWNIHYNEFGYATSIRSGHYVCVMRTNNFEECNANAKLIAEAGTVANETGKTPRQLADDNKVLLEALQNMRVMYWQWIEQHPETQGYKWAKEALSAIKQVTE